MKKIFTILALFLFTACSDKLELKPNSALIVPETAQELESLMENTEVMNRTASLAQISADEYYIPTFADFQALLEPISRTAYIWQPDIYQGSQTVADWSAPYQQVFICNSVLDILNRQDIDNDPEKKRIKGRALFSRAYAFYTLASVFCKGYDAATAGTDLGLPLKLSSDVTDIVQRSTLQQTYDQICNDALAASTLLQQDIPATNKHRPSQVAAFALLARVYLSMREYDKAELYADKTLALYSVLVDYNTLTIGATASTFTYNFEETIYFTVNNDYTQTTLAAGILYGVDLGLLGLYAPNDLRKAAFFRRNATTGNYYPRRIYTTVGAPFTGLATDEIVLIKAECLARRQQTSQALQYLNQLVSKRWNPNASAPAKAYESITASSPEEALDKVLLERRKELVWRSVRWTDIKRLNLEGRNITLTRTLGDKQYQLVPNSPLYVLPIPQDEMALSGIEQNPR